MEFADITLDFSDEFDGDLTLKDSSLSLCDVTLESTLNSDTPTIADLTEEESHIITSTPVKAAQGQCVAILKQRG